MPPKKKDPFDDDDEEVISPRNTSERRSLPSRSSRPVRAAMRDGSEEDDIFNEVTTSPLEKVLKESIRTAKKEAGLKSDDDLPGILAGPSTSAKTPSTRAEGKRGRGRPARSATNSAPAKPTTSRVPNSDGPSRRAVNREVYYGNAYYDEEGTDADTESDEVSSDDGKVRRQAQKKKEETPKSTYNFKSLFQDANLTAAGPSSAPVPPLPIAKSRQAPESPRKRELKKSSRPTERESSEEVIPIDKPEKSTPKPRGKLNLELLDQKAKGRSRKNYAQSLVTTLPHRLVSSLKSAIGKRMATRSVVHAPITKKTIQSKEKSYPKRQLQPKNYDDTTRRAKRKADTDVDESSGFDSDRGSLPNIRISTKRLMKRLSRASLTDLPASPKRFLRQVTKPKLVKMSSGEQKSSGAERKSPAKAVKSAIRVSRSSRSAKTDVEEIDEHIEITSKKLTKVTLKPTPKIVKAAAKVERKHEEEERYDSEGAVSSMRKSNMSQNQSTSGSRPLRERPTVSYADEKRRSPRKNKDLEEEDGNKKEESNPSEEDEAEEDEEQEEEENEAEDEEQSEENEEESEEEEDDHIKPRRSLPTVNYDTTIRRRPRKEMSTNGSSSPEVIPPKKSRKTITPEKIEADEKRKTRSSANRVDNEESEESSSESSESEEHVRPKRALPPVNYKPPPQRQRRPKPESESEESEEEDEERITARRTVTKVDYSDVKRRGPRKKTTESDDQGDEEEGEEEEEETVEVETTRTTRRRTATVEKKEEVKVTVTRRSVITGPKEKKPIGKKAREEPEVSDEEPGPSTRKPKGRQNKKETSPEESSSLPSSFEEEKPKGKRGKKNGDKGQRRPQSSVGQNNYFSGSSSDDDRFVPGTLEEAKDMVKAIYTPILKENDRNMTGEFKNFQNSLKNLPTKEYKLPSGAKPRAMNLCKEEIREGFETVTVGGLKDVVPVHYIPTTSNWPKMKNWVHLEHNIRTRDSFRLSHIPYINDDHDSVSFVKELKKAYPEGIHGTTKGWGKHISDYLLYRLLKAAIPKWQKTGKEMGYLYQAIFKLFPNKLTPRQLQNIYPSLEARFEPTLRKPGEGNRKDDVGHSIRTLLCIKCRQYHCLLHSMTGEPFRMHRQPPPKKYLTQRPCSKDCYLYMPEVELNISSSDEDEPYIKQKPDLVVPEKPFTNDDAKELFQKLVQINRFDSCQLASMISTFEKRTCQEIYVLLKKKRPTDREMSPDDIMIRKQTMKEAQSSFRNFTWNLGQGRVDNSEQHACKHKGACGRNVKDCICGQRDTLCFKYCSCGIDCKMRFPGCRCQPGQCRTKQCQCFYAKWECDPDICKSCNCGPVANVSTKPPKVPELPASFKCEGDDDVDWLEQDNMKLDDEPIPVCSNVNLQRGKHKMLKVGKSDIAGYGCFIGEPCEKGEFIAEYTGEVISQDEAERRGMIYDEYKTSYIFALNKDVSVDATRMGNPIRFANHSDKDPNCYSQIIMVNGEHRIGIFAKRKLYPREELLFDYQYNKKWKAKYCPIVRGAVRDKSISSSPKPGPSRKKK